MKLPILSKKDLISKTKNCFDQERKNGITKAFYTWHYQLDDVNIMDTKQQFDQYVTMSKSQGIELVETRELTQELLERYNIVGGRMHILRHKKGNNISNNYDPISFSFDYMVGSAEWIVYEITLSGEVNNEFVVTKQDETLSVAKSLGLKVFEYGSLKITALNKKNAIKKFGKLLPNFQAEKVLQLN